MLLRYRHSQFWEKFQAEHWRPRVPTVLRNPFLSFPFADAMVLRAMKAFQSGLQSGESRVRHLCAVGPSKGANRAALRKMLEPEHRSLAELEAACTRLFADCNVGLMVNNLESLERGIWEGMSAFLQDAHAWIDFPVVKSVVDLFFGSYSHSFLGLHKDTQEIFAFVVRGEKVILAWPFEYFTSRVKGLSLGARFFQTEIPVDYRKYRKDAIVLRARPGDIIYWPSDYWHIAEGTPGSFSAMLSLGLFLPQYSNPKHAGELNRFREQLLSGPAMRSQDMTTVTSERDADSRLRWATGFGFRLGGPVERTGELTDKPKNMRFVKKETSLLLWRIGARQRVLVATQGHSASLPYTNAITTLLARLSRGEAVNLPAPRGGGTFASIRATSGSAEGKKTVRRIRSRNEGAWLLGWLQSVGAVRIQGMIK